MIDDRYEVIFSSFKSTSDVPKDNSLLYRCKDCGMVIPSIPNNNIGCSCGNVFIDKDYWRLVVADIAKLEVVKKRRQSLESKYSLPHVPTHITDVKVPAGIQMRTTIANDIRIFEGKSVAGNGGGGVRFEVLNKERIPDEVFTLTHRRFRL